MSWSYYIKDLPSVFFEENYPFILNQSSSGFVIEEFEKVLAKILKPKVKQIRSRFRYLTEFGSDKVF